MLTSRQRTYLSALAVSVDPTVMIGKDGAGQAIERAVSAEFKHRELLKIRFVTAREDRAELARALAERTGAELVRVIGKVAVFYKRAADPELRAIELP